MKKFICLLAVTLVATFASTFAYSEDNHPGQERYNGEQVICVIRQGDNQLNYGYIVTSSPEVTIWGICDRVAGGGSPVQVTAWVDGKDYTATIQPTVTGTSRFTFQVPTNGTGIYSWSFELRAQRVPNPTDISIYAGGSGV